MSDAAIHDYLTQQIKVNRNIVTFRLLSRALSIHVNDAKTALAAFYETNKGDQPLHATYLISGEDIEIQKEEDTMEVDSGQPVLDAPSLMAEAVLRTKMMVVPEEKLESSKSLFKSVRGVHVYSVEPSSFLDPNLLVTTVDAVRKMDADRSPEELQKLGIPISAACKFNAKLKAKPKALAPSAAKASTSKLPAKSASATTAVPKKPSTEKVKVEPEEKLPPKKPSKTEPTTKSAAKTGLDWSKAKTSTTKASEKKAASQTKPAAASQDKAKGKEREASVSSSVASEPKPKRGIKRPTPPSDDEEESQQPPKTKARLSAPAIRAKNRVLLSDDEDSEPVKKPVRSKGKSKSDEAMMDWSDEDNVVVANRHSPGPPSSKDDGEDDEDEGTEANSREDDAMETTDGGVEEPKYAKPARTTKKKTWPVGSNGLRKKRVQKTREYTDARGFLQSEDYSEYESVNSESEEPPEPATKKKAVKKVKEETKPQIKKEETKPQIKKEETITTLPKQGSFKSSAPAKPKQSTGLAAGGKKKTLDSFFAKK